MSGTDGVPTDDSYAKAGGITGNDPIPVDSDSAAVESGLGSRAQQDSDEQLQRDDVEAIDESNIIDERTRGAKPQGTYAEPGDEEGLPTDDGTSSAA